MKKIIIWGTGKKARVFIKDLDFSECEISCYVDNDKEKQGTVFEGREIISPGEIKDKEYDMLIICSGFEKEILNQCKELGIEAVSKNNIDLVIDLFSKRKIMQLYFEDRENKDSRSLEYLWSAIFRDTIAGYKWCQNLSLSLGRWAVGYNYAYVVCRILNDFAPRNILELGLGQSSYIMGRYANTHEGVHYEIVEQNSTWIDFMMKSEEINNNNVNIYCSNIIESVEDGILYKYELFDEIVKEKKYSLISVDGPWGGTYRSREDILEYSDKILEDEFVIIFDDSNRIGEKNTIEQLVNGLRSKGRSVCVGVYSGIKDVCVVTTEKWKFLTSL